MKITVAILMAALMTLVIVTSALPLPACAPTVDNQQGGEAEAIKVPKKAPANPRFEAYWANPSDTVYGYIPPPMDLSHLKQIPVERLPIPYGLSSSLDSSFDWRDNGKVTPVKDQSSCGTCWIFGTTAVLESAVHIGESAEYDFSEQSVALCVDRSWVYLYDGTTDPCLAGGWSWLATEAFIKKGSVDETCNPYDTSDLNCDGSCECDTCTAIKKVDGYRLVTNDGSQIDAIQEAVYEHGPVTVAFYYTSSGEYSVAPWGTIYDCYPCTGGANHLVSIVGWNDGVPHPDPDHEGTGAWIVKNSWGTDWGNDGFFYLAYDSSCVTEVAYLDYRDENPDEELLYWDEAGHVSSAGYRGRDSDSAWMASVFEAAQPGYLTHVDFWTTSNNAQYEIYVWDGKFGAELASQTGSCQEYGYYSIPLSTPIALDSNQQFTVGVKMTTEGYMYPIPIELEYPGLVEPPIQSDVSFIRHTGSDSWTDLIGYGWNACLRARMVSGVPENQPPVADAGPDQTALVDEAVSFDGSESYDPDGTIASYDWDFGDGNMGSGEIATHAYTEERTYEVTLTVTDNDGATGTDTATVEVVSEEPTNTLHIESIEMSLKIAGINTKAIATVTILDDADEPVEGATVLGLWSGLTNDRDVGTTDANGNVALVSDRVKRASGTFNFTVDSVTHADLDWDGEPASGSITV